jgi:hypothetical protein
MGARAPFNSFTFLKLASEETRQLSEQAVIPRTEHYNLPSTLAELSVPIWRTSQKPVCT